MKEVPAGIGTILVPLLELPLLGLEAGWAGDEFGVVELIMMDAATRLGVGLTCPWEGSRKIGRTRETIHVSRGGIGCNDHTFRRAITTPITACLLFRQEGL